MRRSTAVMAGSSALAAAFVGGVAVAGGFTPDDTVRVRPQAVTGPAALVGSTDCEELLQWYVERHLPDVGPYGWGGRWRHDYKDLTNLDAAQGAQEPGMARAARTSSETGTNTQEVGVDEPDTAKTDGRLLVQALDGRLVLTDVSGESPRLLGEVSLPPYLGLPELLLVGDTVLVVAQPSYGIAHTWDSAYPGPTEQGLTRVVEVDVSDPAQPVVVETREYDGTLESVRQYGDVVRVVVEKDRPELGWVLPRGSVSEQEARERNRALVRATTIEDWLPSVSDLRGRTSSSVDCADVHRPSVDSGAGTTAVFTQRVGSSELSTVAVAAGAEVVYSSPERLFVATSGSRFGDWPAGSRIMPRAAHTQVHGFALEDDETTYVSSGSVPGSVRDRWSLDEQGGDLRVAFARPGKQGETADNAVVVLDEQLQPRGSVTGLGIEEEIRSVRWFDDLAVVVTFREVDPLYTISFADPRRPRLLGELKIPGFSAYLHPIGEGRLLGLGQDATLQGQQLGAQAAVFDIGTLTKPRELDRHRFAEGTELLAGFEPRAFTWVPSPSGGTAYTLLTGHRAFPASIAPEYGGAPVVVRLAVSGDRITATALKHLADERTRFLPVEGGRVVLAGPEVRILG